MKRNALLGRLVENLTREQKIDLAVKRTLPHWLAWITAHPEQRTKLEAVAQGCRAAICREYRRIVETPGSLTAKSNAERIFSPWPFDRADAEKVA